MVVIFYILAFLWAFPAYGQDFRLRDLTALTSPSNSDILYIVHDPSGTPVDRKITVANLLAAGGTVTSAVIAGTANQITASGTCTITTTGTCTLSLPSALTLPGTINKLTLTAPATGATLTIADGKTVTISNTLTFTGTDSSSVAFGAGGTVLYSGGALGTPSSGTGTNITGIPGANLTNNSVTSTQ